MSGTASRASAGSTNNPIEIDNLSPFQKRAMEVIGGGGTLKDVAGLGDADIETIHAIGHTLYSQAKYDQAEPMFQFACFYSHLEPRYWMSLGNCRQATKNYQAAIDAYGTGYMLDTDDAWPAIQVAICYLALGNKELARDSLALAGQAIKNRPDEKARQRISALRQAL